MLGRVQRAKNAIPSWADWCIRQFVFRLRRVGFLRHYDGASWHHLCVWRKDSTQRSRALHRAGACHSTL